MNYYPQDVKPVSTADVEAPPLQTISEQLTTRKDEARTQMILNLRNAFNEIVGTVKVATPGRDVGQSGRQRYERNYQRMLDAAKQLILATGEQLSVPAYLPPPSAKESISILDASSFPKPPPDDDSAIRARKAAEAKANIRPGTPGSDSQEAWLAFQGAKK